MTDDLTGRRLEDVKDNISKDFDLLKDFEDELRLETDPRKMGKYELEIKRQRESLARYSKEYEELKKQAEPAQIQKVADLLKQQETKLDAIRNLMNMQHPRIFISYSRSDGEEFARKLRHRLINEYNLSVWQDRTDMEGGKDWWKQIEGALRSKHVEYLVMVMTPNALRSDVVKKEWRLARTEGVCVVPVQASKDLDFDRLPKWMSAWHFVDIDIQEQWDRFILTLKSSCQTQRVPFMVEDLPDDFVQRPGKFNQLISNLLEEKREEAVAITAALRGAGGYGKTTLARALCHDEHVQEAFYDGILWVTLGKEPGDLIEKVNDLIEILSVERPGFRSIESATNHLVELLASRHMLIVIDDVWNAAHLKPFLQGGSQCARLITTRNFDTLPPYARRIDVDAMQQNEAVALICSGLTQGKEADLSKLAGRLGEWPLLLKLVNGALRDRVHNSGQSLTDALLYVNRALDNRGLTFFDARDVEAREQAVGKTLGVSLELLYPKEHARYNELAIFPEDVDIPLHTLEKLWNKTDGFSDFDTEELCDRLRKLSLLLHFDPVTRHIRLHDVVRQYLIHEQRDGLQALHNQLLDAYRSSLPQQSQSSFTDWAALPAKEQYFWRNIAYHLVEAGRKEELQKLLIDFAWIRAKLDAVDVNALIRDYDFISSDRNSNLVQKAIRLSAHILARDKKQLRSQLYGRLMGQDAPEIKTLLGRIKQRKDGPLLCSITPSLTPPGPLLRTLEGHTDWVTAVSVMPDGKRAISGSSDKTLKVWNLERGEVINTLKGHTHWVTAVSVMPDGKRAISGSSDKTIKVWDLESGEVINTLQGHTGFVYAVSVLPGGKQAISGSGDYSIKVWDLERGEVINTLQGHTDFVYAVSVLPDGKRAISGSRDKTIKVWDLERGEVINTLKGHTNIVTAVSVLPDGKRAISGSSDNTIKLWDLESGEVINTLKGHTDTVIAVSVLPDGKQAISGSRDKTIKLWDLESGEVINTFKGHTDFVYAVSVLPDGKRAISGSSDETIKLWDLESREVINTLKSHTDEVTAVSVLPDGKRAISGSRDYSIKVWNLESGEVINTLKGHTGFVTAVSVLPDGKRAISGSRDKTIKLWDLENGEVINTLQGHTGSVNGVSVLPDGKRAISGSGDYSIKVWDLESGEVINTLPGHNDIVTAVSVLPDGKRAISGSLDNTIKLWDLERGEVINTLKGHTNIVTAVSVLPDGKRAISGSGDKTIKVWDLESGEVINTLQGHTGSVNGVSVLPGGKRAISGSEDNSIKVWDLESGEAITSFSGDSPLSSITVNQDGKIIIAGEESGKVHFLRLEEVGIIPQTQIEHKIACLKCGSDDVTFSKKKQLYVCPDCHHEFVVEKKISS